MAKPFTSPLTASSKRHVQSQGLVALIAKDGGELGSEDKLGDALGSLDGVWLGSPEGQVEVEGKALGRLEILGDGVTSSWSVSLAKILLCSISIITRPFVLPLRGWPPPPFSLVPSDLEASAEDSVPVLQRQ